MYFDRFDIAEAWYLYLSLNCDGQGSDLYRRLCRLLRRFHPRPLLHGPEDLTENGKAIFDSIGM
jgi:hypothetical protein